MRFVSTRTGASLSFQDAILAGWAPDGGMLLPESLPAITREKLQSWSKLTYPQLALDIFACLLEDEDFSRDDLEDIFLGTSLSNFGVPEVVRVQQVQMRIGSGLLPVGIAELWHGPTLAFKDLGLQVLAQFLQKILRRRNQTQIMLVGTSGDTGSAAIEAVRNIPEIGIIVLYPSRLSSNISECQELQICRHVDNPRVRVIKVEGSSDDLDVPIDALFHNGETRAKYHFGSLNSVNIIRLLMQVVHLFYSYLHCEPNGEKQAVFSIPTGAGGHVTSAMIAVKMGLPASDLLLCTNENSFLPQLLQTSEGVRKAVVNTSSPAMDIQVPYNIERMLYLASKGDHNRVSQWMSEFHQRGKLQVTPDVLDALCQIGLRGVTVTCDSVKAAAQSLNCDNGYLIDPHTAVGVAGLQKWLCNPGMRSGDSRQPSLLLCMACAHPSKFPEFINEVCEGQDQTDMIGRMPDKHHRHVADLLELQDQAASRNSPVECHSFFKAADKLSWTAMLLEHVVALNGVLKPE